MREGEKVKTANEKERKMLYNGLSANAKGWLLAKHHFATSSIFHQHVKGSAPTSLSPTTPLSSSLPPLLSLKACVKSNHEGKQPNAFRSRTLG